MGDQASDPDGGYAEKTTATAISDKLFVLTPDGDMRVLLDQGDPVKVDALEQAFFRNQVTEAVLFATGQGVAPGWRASPSAARISERSTSDR